MAATLTSAGELTFISFPIDKFEKTADGDLIVYGKATDGSVDSDEQIVDTNFSAKAIQEWLDSGANVRVQHNAQRDPAGVGIEAHTDADGTTWVKSLVCEPIAKTLVEKKALRAYSVGIARPTIVRDNVARGGRIVDGQIVEISLVDRPANKNCGIELVKADKNGQASWVGKMFGDNDILTKSETGVTVDLPKDVSVSFSPADLAKLLNHRKEAEKRQTDAEIEKKKKKDDKPSRNFDPSVGGGVDRAKLPSKDFAGRNRSFPIVTPGDVSDAASSIGRAGEDNYSGDKLKRNIIRIARRKGDSFVAELPESWKKELGMEKSDDITEVEKRKKPFKDAHPKFGDEHQPPHGEEDEEAIAERKKKADAKEQEAKPDTTKGAKGMKTCVKCNKGFDADSKLRRCPGCNAKLPKADKSVDVEAAKKQKVMCVGCGANQKAKHGFCSECGKSLKDAETSTMKSASCACGCGCDCAVGRDCECDCDNCGDVGAVKNHKFTCLNCNREPLDKGERFCPGCGTENPGYLPVADAQLKVVKGVKVQTKRKKNKKGKPTPGAGVVGAGASAIEPVPSHREPDGKYIEELESDAGMPTTPDASVKAAQRLKSVGAPFELGALHDLTCPAFDPTVVKSVYPVHGFDTLDENEWQQKALDAAANAPFDEASKMAELWQHVSTLKAADAQMLDEVRADMHKSFRDANPGPGSFPTPMELSPVRFRRPLITAGHEAPSPGHDGANTAKVPTTDVSANQFNRGPLTDGHAASSPSNKGADVLPAPVPTGSPQRTYYRNVQRDHARSAMAAMHDHITQTFPDLCSMTGPGTGGEAPVGARPVPVPATKAEKKSKGKKVVKVRKNQAPVVEKVATLDAEIVKSAVVDALTPLAEQVEVLTKALNKERKNSAKLARTVEELSNMADPTVTAFKGVAAPEALKSSAPVVSTVASAAERTQAALMAALQEQARHSPDPSEREAAWAKLYQMNGIQ